MDCGVFKNQKGSTIVMALLAGGLVLTSMFVVLSSMQSMEQSIDIQKVKQSAMNARNSMMALLDNDAGWSYLVAMNSASNGMGCLRTNGAVCSSGSKPLKYYEMESPLTGTPAEQITGFYRRYIGRDPIPSELADKLTMYPSGLTDADVQSWLASCTECDSLQLRIGFTMDGLFCQNYGTGIGPDCPFQYELTWECSTGVCPTTIVEPGSLVALEPRIRLQGRIKMHLKNAKLQEVIRKNRFDFDFVRGTNSKTLSRFCNSIAGVFDQASQICKNANNTGNAVDCAAALGLDPKFVRFAGYTRQPNGTMLPVCVPDPKLDGWCSPGTAIIALRTNGTYQCGAF